VAGDKVRDIVAGWAEQIGGIDPLPRARINRTPTGGLEMILSVTIDGTPQILTCPVRTGPPEEGPQGLVWGVIRIAPGVYKITPSLNAIGVLHAFVTIVGVPEVPAWDGRQQ
jgi:hypothetical protein